MVVFLTLCLGALLGDKEPPQVWASLANCTVLAKTTRRDCVLQLFRRHVKPGMPLSEVARLLDHPDWLKDEGIHFFDFITGWVPVRLDGGDALYTIRIFPELGIESGFVYLAVAKPEMWPGGVGLARVLQGRIGDKRWRTQVVRDFWADGMLDSAAGK
jgi:hypothetical protein